MILSIGNITYFGVGNITYNLVLMGVVMQLLKLYYNDDHLVETQNLMETN